MLRVEGGIPHIYASDRADLARVFGFVQAQDRFFSMDLARRLGLGEVSSLLGDSAVDAREDTGCFGGRLFVFRAAPCNASSISRRMRVSREMTCGTPRITAVFSCHTRSFHWPSPLTEKSIGAWTAAILLFRQM